MLARQLRMSAFDGKTAQLTELSTGEPGEWLVADSVIAPLHGTANDRLHRELQKLATKPVIAIGDCQAPRTALEAVFEGHEAGRRV